MSDEEHIEEVDSEGVEGDDHSEYDEGSESSYSSSDDETDLVRRNLLFLCQEGQLRIANQRFDTLVQENNIDQLKREIFQTGTDRNTPLHEILCGGTSDSNAKALTEKILDISQQWTIPYRAMLIAQPPSHLRTALHWATWGNSDISIIETLVNGNPEALVVRDRRNKGNRTATEIYSHYFIHRDRTGGIVSEENKAKFEFLEKSMQKWVKQRVRNTVYASVLYYFRNQSLTPFNQKDRKIAGIKPKPWFVLSTLGYLIQREITPLVSLVLSFIGKDAKIQGITKKRKRS
ncbi:hypothetical protein CTEN210_11392 [Chaetoceros tenuissimus]|uniref:Uncharacterized protein n=1 Tax=Chaetoceros tenuissimus TaxID=426638 RepID=A0AAD3H992_9STRA|nr:hypothetical protein CTEN210_11392 [Chaetoceros tenuissimus]